ncbi:MAG TPA: hypothetical protein DDY72_02520 [Verrucomicrobia bacterium]|nr:hypothetical protein [Verrucomicrobiota bacterium]
MPEMTRNTSSKDNAFERNGRHNALGWLFFPAALFPFVALLTYDWRAIGILQTPAKTPVGNWIGPLGNYFAYYGYMSLGLAVWAVPLILVVLGVRLVTGRLTRLGRRELWLTLVLAAGACLLQLLQPHSPLIRQQIEALNIPAAGGVVGYLLVTRALSPLLSDFGASLVVLTALIAALVAAVGLPAFLGLFKGLFRWALGPALRKPAADMTEEERAALEAAQAAREEARREREAEKARVRAEKEAARAAKEAARRQQQEAARPEPPPAPAAPQPAPPRAPAARTDSATAVAVEEEAKGPYTLPPLSLLHPLSPSNADHSDVEEMSRRLIDTLKLFNVDAKLSYTVKGPVVTKYALLLAPGIRYSAVTNIADNIKGALHAKSLRIEAPIPGDECIGIEVPNRKPAGISFREIIESETWKSAKMELPLLFGKDASGRELVADLASMPHMLVAGATGQGKSVCLNSIICGLLMTRTPEQLKLIMVDPKSVEFTPYSNIPHLLVPVITDNRKVVFSLHWAVAEMEKRLKLFARNRVRNIYDYNHRKSIVQTDMFGESSGGDSADPRTIPYIVIIIDEVADLMMAAGKEVTPDISRLTAKARAAGIHLILATQRPDAKIITGTIKANIPGRVAFKTSQAIDSRTILDDAGAENLIGRGDMLFKGKDGILTRAQGAWISDEEIANITAFIEEHSSVQFDKHFATKLGRVKEATIDDPFAANEDDPDNQPRPEASPAAQRQLARASADADLFTKAIEVIINTNRASVSHFQRKLGIGYNHAAKLCDELEERGVVAPHSGAGPRTILLDQNQLEAILRGEDAAAMAAPSPEAPTEETPSADENAAFAEYDAPDADVETAAKPETPAEETL